MKTHTHVAVLGRERIESNLPLPAASRLRPCAFCAILPEIATVNVGVVRYEEVVCRCRRSIRQIATAAPSAAEIWNEAFARKRR